MIIAILEAGLLLYDVTAVLLTEKPEYSTHSVTFLVLVSLKVYLSSLSKALSFALLIINFITILKRTQFLLNMCVLC